MALNFTTSYLEDSIGVFRYYKRLAEGAMEQVTDEELYASFDPEMNSIAVMVKHMAGNMCSRWSEFLTTDGEKPGRNRDCEFEQPPQTPVLASTTPNVKNRTQARLEGEWMVLRADHAATPLPDEALGAAGLLLPRAV